MYKYQYIINKDSLCTRTGLWAQFTTYNCSRNCLVDQSKSVVIKTLILRHRIKIFRSYINIY